MSKLKIFQTLAILTIAAIIGYHLGKELGNTEEEKNENAIWGVLLMLIVGGAISAACNTVNYTLWLKNQKMYCGIAYDSRLAQRLKEHTRSGKTFDNVTHGYSLPRELAHSLEIVRIKTIRPKLNIQHNC